MINEFELPEDKVYVCTFIASLDNIEEALEYCQKYLNSEEETEFNYALMFMLYGLLKYEGTTIAIDSGLRECLEDLIQDKKIRRNNRG